MLINHSKDAHGIIVYLNGELDEHSALNARTELDNIIENNQFDRITYDLGQLTFMDSTGIGVLIGRYKKLKAKKSICYVKNVSASIDKIFLMAGLYTIMQRSDIK